MYFEKLIWVCIHSYIQTVARMLQASGQINIFSNFASISSRSQILKVCEYWKNLITCYSFKTGSLEERLELIKSCIFACIPDYHCFWLFGTYIRWSGAYRSRLNCLAHNNTLINLCRDAYMAKHWFLHHYKYCLILSYISVTYIQHPAYACLP